MPDRQIFSEILNPQAHYHRMNELQLCERRCECSIQRALEPLHQKHGADSQALGYVHWLENTSIEAPSNLLLVLTSSQDWSQDLLLPRVKKTKIKSQHVLEVVVWEEILVPSFTRSSHNDVQNGFSGNLWKRRLLNTLCDASVWKQRPFKEDDA